MVKILEEKRTTLNFVFAVPIQVGSAYRKHTYFLLRSNCIYIYRPPASIERGGSVVVSVVVSTSALRARVLSSIPGPGMSMFDVKTWFLILGTVFLS